MSNKARIGLINLLSILMLFIISLESQADEKKDDELMYNYQEYTERISLKKTELADNSYKNTKLIFNPKYANMSCVTKLRYDGRLFLKLNLGDYYQFGKIQTSINQLKISLQVSVAKVNSTVQIDTKTIELEFNDTKTKAEEIVAIDATNLFYDDNGNLVTGFTITNINTIITINGTAYTFATYQNYGNSGLNKIISSLKLDFYFESEKKILPISTTGQPLIYAKYYCTSTVPTNYFYYYYVENGYSEKNHLQPIRLQWYLLNTCVDNPIPYYHVQILRLENKDPNTASRMDIIADIDWSKALNLYVGNYQTYIDLRLTEGDGVYLWRVRPVGNYYEGDMANDLNYGLWNQIEQINSTGSVFTNYPHSSNSIDGFDNFTPSSRANKVRAFINYYREDFVEQWADYTVSDQFGNTNWSSKKVITEDENKGTKILEDMTHYDDLMRPRQSIVVNNAQDVSLVSQMYYDHLGRNNITTLAMPKKEDPNKYYNKAGLWLKPGSFSGLKYKPSILTLSGISFNEYWYNNPNTLNSVAGNGGLLNEFYNGDGTLGDNITSTDIIPSAQGFPYTRTIFEEDGTGRVKASGNTGAVFSYFDNSANDHTKKMIYTNVCDDEIVPLFGDETPASNTVRKVITIDENNVEGINYFNKEGQLIASGINDNSNANNLDALTNESRVGKDSYKYDVLQYLPVGTGYKFKSNYSIDFPNASTSYELIYNFVFKNEQNTIESCFLSEEKKKVKFDVNIDLSLTKKDDPTKNNYYPFTKSWKSKEQIFVDGSDIPIIENGVNKTTINDNNTGANATLSKGVYVAERLLEVTNVDALIAEIQSDITTNLLNNALFTDITKVLEEIDGHLNYLKAHDDITADDYEANTISTFYSSLVSKYGWTDNNGYLTYPLPMGTAQNCYQIRIKKTDCENIIDDYELYFKNRLLEKFRGLKIYDPFDKIEGIFNNDNKWYNEINRYIYIKKNGQYYHTNYSINTWINGLKTNMINYVAPSGTTYSQYNESLMSKAWMTAVDMYINMGIVYNEEESRYEIQAEFDLINIFLSIAGRRYNGFVNADVTNQSNFRIPFGQLFEKILFEFKLPPDNEYKTCTELLDAYNKPTDGLDWDDIYNCINNYNQNAKDKIQDKVTKNKDLAPEDVQKALDLLDKLENGSDSEKINALADYFAVLTKNCLDANPTEKIQEKITQYFNDNYPGQSLGTSDNTIIFNAINKMITDECTVTVPPGSNSTYYELDLKLNAIATTHPINNIAVPGAFDGTKYNFNSIIVTRDNFITTFPDLSELPFPNYVDCNEETFYAHKQYLVSRLNEIYSSEIKKVSTQIKNLAADIKNYPTKYFKETFNITIKDLAYKHFTLYYYDRAGNLVQTVPPKGINTTSSRSTPTSHYDKTEVSYNSLNQIVSSKSPEEASAQMSFYDSKNRLLLSQNAQQQINNAATYVKYDKKGRILETGEVLLSNNSISAIQVDLEDQNYTYIDGNRKEYIEYVYSKPYYFHTSTVPSGITVPYYMNNNNPYIALLQNNILNKLSYTVRHNPKTDALILTPATDAYNVYTIYSYDLYGNTEWIIKRLPFITQTENIADKDIYSKIKYEYEIISGNLKSVTYNEQRNDQFHQKFDYDQDNKITKVYTSRDSIDWEEDQSYEFYLTGALKSSITGHDIIAKNDYYYTLTGALKGVNKENVTADAPSALSLDRGIVKPAKKTFGYSLSYYANDFLNSNNPFDVTLSLSTTNSLYNGMIKMERYGFSNEINTGINTNGANIMNTENRIYKYDKLYRLMSDNNYVSAPNDPTAFRYASIFKYDPNSNISSIIKYNNTTSSIMKTVTTNIPLTNDKISTTTTITGSTTKNNNYSYDNIGNLKNTGDVVATWTFDGKVRRTTSTITTLPPPCDLGYDNIPATFNTLNIYDADGNKVVVGNILSSNYLVIGPPEHPSTYECEECAKQLNIGANYYVYDLQNKNVAIYKSDFTCPVDPKQQYTNTSYVNLERWLVYGASGRIGSQLPPRLSPISRDFYYSQNIPDNTAPNRGRRLLGNKEYEITDHLGNVRVMLSDIKMPADITSDRLTVNYTADVLNAANYYPYGEEIPQLTWNAAYELPYLFGYNGMLKDNHIAGEGNAYYTLFREYDPTLGRWWSADPMRAKYPSMSPYLAFGANPISFTDVMGDDLKVGATNPEGSFEDLKSLLPNDIQNNTDIIQYIPTTGDVIFDIGSVPEQYQQYEGILLLQAICSQTDIMIEYNATANFVGVVTIQNPDGTQSFNAEFGGYFSAFPPCTEVINTSEKPRLTLMLINNYSTQDYLSTDPGKEPYNLPDTYYKQGSIFICPGTFYTMKEPQRINAVYPRQSLVFHELMENYNRTSLGQYYNVAHSNTILKERNFARQLNISITGLILGASTRFSPDCSKVESLEQFIQDRSR